MKMESKSGRNKYQLVPKAGTKLREMYDLFINNKATPVFLPFNNSGDGVRLNNLRDYYGLDIRAFNSNRPRKYWLVGEWFGETYVDYVADKLK